MAEDFEIIDAHHHLWDLDQGHYPFLAGHPEPDFFLGDYSALRCNYLPHDYRKDSSGHNIIATVHCEAERERSDQVGETNRQNDPWYAVSVQSPEQGMRPAQYPLMPPAPWVTRCGVAA